MAIFSKLGNYKNTGLLLMRVGIGAMFVIIHGYPKMLAGPSKWEQLGGNLRNIGIDFFPAAWGFLAAGSELIGGLLLILGLFFRPACLFLLGTLTIAAMSYFWHGQGFFAAAHPIEVGFAILGLFILGPGKYSIDKS
jgi:putative oxidoreductase